MPRRNRVRVRRRPRELPPEPDPTTDQLAASLVRRGLAPIEILGWRPGRPTSASNTDTNPETTP